ncbi:MAG: cell division protein FtsK, partial [Sciscionella sp.]
FRLNPPVEQVFDAEIVDEAEYQASKTRRAVQRVQALPVVVVARTVATHETTRTTGKAALRHVLYVPAGMWVVGLRVWEAKTNSRYERMMRAAEAAGDYERVADWETRAQAAKKARHERAMDWLEAPGKLARAGAIVAASIAAVLLVIGLVLMAASHDPSQFLAPFNAAISLIHGIIVAVAVAWGPLVLAAPWVAVLTFWWIGRHAGRVPGWLQVNQQGSEELVVDERAIAHALQHLGIAPMARYFKDGGMLTYTSMPATDGLGVTAQVRLPAGVTAADVIRQKKRLAANLSRSAVETWPSTGPDEGLLDLWVADHGALDTGAGPWPWLELQAPVEVFAGVPVGITMRGTQVIAPIDGTSWLIGGRPGQGKSTFARLLVIGACLDPTAEIWVYVLADNPDFDPLQERFTRYEVGMGNEVAQAAMQAFRDLLAEIAHRGHVMRECGAETAAKAGFHPLLCVFDEVHRLFQHREYGKEAGEVAEDVIKQARKYGVIVVLATQSPTATSIPKAVTRETVCRVAFSVVDQVGNDALLGSGKYRQGVSATELRPGSEHAPGDRGKALTVGVVPDVDWSMVLAHFVGGADLPALAHRAMRRFAEHGAVVARTDHETERDLLDDLDSVLSDEPIPAAKVPALLHRLAPRWAAYRSLTGKQLRMQLAELGVRVPSTDHRYPVDRDAVREAIGRRADEE